jgi:hypothetical protein
MESDEERPERHERYRVSVGVSLVPEQGLARGIVTIPRP